DDPVKEPEPERSKHPSDASEVKESGTTASDLPRLSSRSMRDRPLPPVPHFLEASEAESIMAELAHQEAVLKELQVMEELHAEELELAKLLSCLELEQTPNALPPSKTTICPDQVDTLPMSWDDPTSAAWAPPVEPLLEDASKLEADSWAELGLHPYDGDGQSCDAKPTLLRAQHIDEGPGVAVAAAEEVPAPPSAAASEEDAIMDDCGAEQNATEPTGSEQDAVMDDCGAEQSAPEPTGSMAESAVADDTAADAVTGGPDTEADQRAPKPSNPGAMPDGEAERASLEPPACMETLMPISPQEQTKALGTSGRDENSGESDDGGAKHATVKKAPKNGELEHSAKRAKCTGDARDDASDEEDDSPFEAGFRFVGSTKKLSKAAKKAAVAKAGGRCGKKAAKAAEDGDKKTSKAAEDRDKKSTKTGEDRKKPAKAAEDRKKSTKAGEDHKKSTK
ncbi:unnamed protein product, partial [Symbiodinium necroappetens]